MYTPILRRTFSIVSPVLRTAVLVALVAIPAAGQAFADLKSSLVDYSKATSTPRKTCEAMGRSSRKRSRRSRQR